MLRVISCLMVLLAVSSSEDTGCTPGITNVDLSRMTEGTWIWQKVFLPAGTGDDVNMGSFGLEIDFLQQTIVVPPEVTNNMSVVAAKIKFDSPIPYVTTPLLALGAISRNDGIIYPAGVMFHYEIEGESELQIDRKYGGYFTVVGTDYDSWLLVSICDTLDPQYTTETGAAVFSRSQNMDEATMTSIKDQYPSLFSNLPEEFPKENTIETRAAQMPFFFKTFFKDFIYGVI